MLQQEIAEEGQRELERRKQGMEEEWRRQAESMEAQQREKAELFDLRSEINALQVKMLLLRDFGIGLWCCRLLLEPLICLVSKKQ